MAENYDIAMVLCSNVIASCYVLLISLEIFTDSWILRLELKKAFIYNRIIHLLIG